jgi:hypothetical protein
MFAGNMFLRPDLERIANFDHELADQSRHRASWQMALQTVSASTNFTLLNFTEKSSL